MTDPTVQTAATQALSGVTLAAGGKTDCTACTETVREGDAVGVYAARGADDTRFEPARVHCRDCRDESIPHEASDTRQLTAFGTLAVTAEDASREARLTLRDPDLVAHSPPAENEQND